MDRSTYMEALHGVNRYILNPTPEDIVAITPHLTEEQRELAIKPKKNSLTAYFAIPPTRVKYGYLVASYSLVDGETSLDIGFPKRTRKSYAKGQNYRDSYYYVPFENEAMAFAEAQWGDALILDTWESVGQVYLQDPSDLTDNGYPKTKAVIYYATDREYNDFMQGKNAPWSDMWNNSIVELTLDEVEGMEFRGGRGGYVEYNCAYCSFGLALNKCNNCGYQFVDNYIRSGWDVPIAEKMVTLLQKHGYQFKLEPAIARNRERQAWERWKKTPAR
jgi:hypothetical protein